ncbi:MAG: C1 family peptidase [bacterium]|nr:C1 family peptidase [bacterium]
MKKSSLVSIALLSATLAGCGLSPMGATVTPSSGKTMVADGTGTLRSFGYRFVNRGVSPIFNIPGVSTRALPARVDLRETGKISPVYDQGSLGSCTAFAMGKGLRETLNNLAGNPSPSLSALYMYYKEREARGTVNEDSGALMIDGMDALKKHGICLDSTIPYNPAKFAVKPSAAAEKEAADQKISSHKLHVGLEALKAELAAGHPAVFGFMVYRSFMSPVVARTGKMPMPRPSENIIGGHAVFIVGYDDAQKVLIIKNSWGTKWGDKGYFYMPYDYVTPDRVDEIFTGEI